MKKWLIASLCLLLSLTTLSVSALSAFIPGDVDGNESVDKNDAIYLLMHSFFPEDYPINQEADYNGNGVVDKDDAIHLLMYTFFPEDYPLAPLPGSASVVAENEKN